MSSRERVCSLDELSIGKGREFVVDGRVVALFRTDEGVYAIDGICPHAGGPLAQGMLRNHVVTCPWHGWQYDVRTGCHQINSRIHVQPFSVTVDQNDVYVEITPPEPAP
ncbi:MAG: ferredoxin [Planctomycetales bacterium 12-60-4]|nr:MAG: ferredoxin [Planctomycetales bacterium 12-60-4]